MSVSMRTVNTSSDLYRNACSAVWRQYRQQKWNDDLQAGQAIKL